MTEPKPPKGNRRRNTPDDTRRQLNARKAEQAKPADGALTWRQSEPGESWTMVASPEFYVEADTRDGYRYVIEPAVKKVPPTPSYETPIQWLRPRPSPRPITTRATTPARSYRPLPPASGASTLVVVYRNRATMTAPARARARKPSNHPKCGACLIVPGNGRGRPIRMRSRRRTTILIIAAVTKNATRPAMPPISQTP
jgi:hypothetical protein